MTIRQMFEAWWLRTKGDVYELSRDAHGRYWMTLGLDPNPYFDAYAGAIRDARRDCVEETSVLPVSTEDTPGDEGYNEGVRATTNAVLKHLPIE